MTGELGLLVLEASGPSTWPGCLSRGLRSQGWGFVTAKVQAAKLVHPELRRVLIDNPFGKWRARDISPTHEDATLNEQTLIDQWTRCRAEPRCRMVADIGGFLRMVADCRSLGVEPVCYVGWKEEDIGPNELAEAIMPFSAARVAIASDGLSAFPWDSWIVDQAKLMGIPEVWTEGMPECGSPMDRPDIPCCHMDNGFDTPEKRERAALLKCGKANTHLLHTLDDHSAALAWMQMGGSVFAVLADALGRPAPIIGACAQVAVG